MIYSEGTARKITQYFKDKLGMRDYRNGLAIFKRDDD